MSRRKWQEVFNLDRIDEQFPMPIDATRNDILGNPARYQLVVADTASGKTAKIAMWFASLGMRVLVTEPLIETVVRTASFVAQMTGTPLGKYVGYAIANEKYYNDDTRIVYSTDGLALYRQLAEADKFDVILFDELHVWNKNQSTIEAFSWKKFLEEPYRFEMLMGLSADLNAEVVSEARENAPIHRVKVERQYQMHLQTPGASIEDDIIRFVRAGYDVLTFLDGWNSIRETFANVDGSVKAEVMQYHSGRTPYSQKQRIFMPTESGLPKVMLSTNALESGATIPPSREGVPLAIITSGWEKNMMLVDGELVLTSCPLPISRRTQQLGRGARLSDSVGADHCDVPDEERPRYPEAEIQTIPVDDIVLRLGAEGYDALGLPFVHALDPGQQAAGVAKLQDLGFMNGDGHLTRDGEAAALLGRFSTEQARFMLEAQDVGMPYAAVSAVSLLQSGMIRPYRQYNTPGYVQFQGRSDLLAEASLMLKTNLSDDEMSDLMTGELSEYDLEHYVQVYGVDPVQFKAALKMRKILRTSSRRFVQYSSGDTGTMRDLRRAYIKSHATFLFKKSEEMGGKYYADQQGRLYEVSFRSELRGGSKWLIAIPSSQGFMVGDEVVVDRRVIIWCTHVTLDELLELAPQHLSQRRTNYRWNTQTGQLECEVHIEYAGHHVETAVVTSIPDSDHIYSLAVLLKGYDYVCDGLQIDQLVAEIKTEVKAEVDALGSSIADITASLSAKNARQGLFIKVVSKRHVNFEVLGTFQGEIAVIPSKKRKKRKGLAGSQLFKKQTQVIFFVPDGKGDMIPSDGEEWIFEPVGVSGARDKKTMILVKPLYNLTESEDLKEQHKQLQALVK